MTVTHVKTEAEFDEQVQKSKDNGTLLLVDFSAAWCGPCKMIYPKLEAMSEEFPDVAFVKVDVDELASVASKAGVTAMPTFHLFKAGEKVGEVVGANESGVKQLITANI